MHLQELRERCSSCSTAGIFFVIMGISFLTRCLLSILYALRFGYHAVPYVETYFYYGVLSGDYALPSRDPTHIIFYLSRSFIPSRFLYPFLIILGILLISLSASLVFLVAKELFGKERALVCGILYAFMVEPLTMGILLFTHDLVQLPFFLLACLTALRVANEKKVRLRVAYLVLLLTILALGWFINAVIFVALETILLFSILLIAGYIGRKAKVEHDVRGWLLGALVVSFVIARMAGVFSVPATLRIISTLFPAYRYEGLLSTFLAGSPDFVPVGFDAIWTRYNVLVLILPFSLYEACRKRYFFPLTLLVVTFFNANFFDRATRLMDVAFALIIPHVLFGWDRRYDRYAYILLSSGLILAIIFLLGSRFSPLLLIVFLVPLLLFLGIIIYSRRREGARLGYAVILVICFLNIPFTYLMVSSFSPQATEGEWRAARSLPADNGMVLVPWAQAFFFTTVSRHPSQVPPGAVDFYYYEILMMDEEKAYAILAERPVTYLFISDREFRVYIDPATRNLSASLHPYYRRFLPPDAKMEYVKTTLAYRMLYESATLSHFRIVYETTDEATGMRVRFFVVQRTKPF